MYSDLLYPDSGGVGLTLGWLLAWGCFATTLLTGFQTSSAADSKAALDEISGALNTAQKHLDEYGTISVSVPILTYARSNEFAFRLTNGAAVYFNDAKSNTQGRAASFLQSFQSTTLRAQAEADPTVAASYMAAAQNYLSQDAAYKLQQDSIKKAAEAQLQGALALATTNTSPGASNTAVADALRNYASQIYGTNGPPVFPVASSFNGTNGVLGSGTFTPFLTDTDYGRLQAMQPFMGLLTSTPPGLATSDRAALLTAAGDNAVESFFRALGDSSLYKNFLNPEIYYGAFTVSVNPGWRTQKDWAGEVNVKVDLEFNESRRQTVFKVLNDPSWPADLRAAIAKDYGYPVTNSEALVELGFSRAEAARLAYARDIPRAESSIPHSFLSKAPIKPVEVMVISPMIEAENFDLASSYRQQREIALSLAAALTYAGAKGQAELFEKFARSRQFDIQTRSPLAAVNAFSRQEGCFGFQIGPQPRALRDPADRHSGPGEVLERQAFPALLIVTTSGGELEPRVVVQTNDCGTVFRIHEPYLAFRQTRRWTPLKRSFFSGRDWYMPNRWFHPKLTEGQRMASADALESAGKLINSLKWDDKLSLSVNSGLGETLRERLRFYEREIIGTVDTLGLPQDRLVPPPPGDVAIVAAHPPSVILGTQPGPQEVEFFYAGSNLEFIEPAVTSVYPNATEPRLERLPGLLKITAKISGADYPVVFQLPLSPLASARTLVTPPVKVTRPSALPRVIEAAPRLITLKHDGKGSTNLDASILIVGTRLDRVPTDTNHVVLKSGHATLRGTERVGDALKMNVTVAEPGEAIVFELQTDLKDGAIPNFSLLTPGVSVEREAGNGFEPPKPPKSAGLSTDGLVTLSGVFVTVNTNALTLADLNNPQLRISSAKTNHTQNAP
jgi:hypothetical protein